MSVAEIWVWRAWTSPISHRVSGQYTCWFTFIQLSSTVKVFQRYCLSQPTFQDPHCDAATMGSYMIPLILTGGGIWSVFTGNPFTHPVITIHNMIRLVLPVYATMEGRIYVYFNKDISRSTKVGPPIWSTVMIWRSHQWGPKIILLPIAESCMEGTVVILIQSPNCYHMQNWCKTVQLWKNLWM